MKHDYLGARAILETGSGPVTFYQLAALEKAGLTVIDRLPFSIRILLEALLRQIDGRIISEDDVNALAAWKAKSDHHPDVPFLPSRVIMQDFTGVPALVDYAAMRAELARQGGDPARINPLVPVDLVIDHSVQVDYFASPDALQRNAEIEFQRNRERYEFLRWGQDALEGVRVVPPATGIVHQVNLEYLATVVQTRKIEGATLAFPDSLVGTDSHTTMINGLGVLGWGVGGIEAEAATLGQPLVIVAPQVVGMRLVGSLPEGTTATDLVLTITQILRNHNVVGKFVEFLGPGLDQMSLPDRATLANMAPEYGATVGFFPVDDETLRYLRFSGRSEGLVDIVERYCKEQGIFRTKDAPDPEFSEILELDLGTVEPSLAGPKRPQDRVPLSKMKQAFEETLVAPTSKGGFDLEKDALERSASFSSNGVKSELKHGSVVIAAITSCTNTSNPTVMVGAGLLASRAVARGLKIKPYVKTSLAPGSLVVSEYLRRAGLIEPLAKLGFDIVGYGCTTCIGNSGPLPPRIAQAVSDHDLVAAAVLSGNRNFEGRINPHARASYLASPPLVVAYALAGRVDIDFQVEPLGEDSQGEPVYLRDIWPSSEDINQVLGESLTPEMFKTSYADVFSGNATWNAIPPTGGQLFEWDPESTYIKEPPFFLDLPAKPPAIEDVQGARVLVRLGDSVTTDHISPAGAIPVDSPAGKYLIEHGVEVADFNSFGSRRGNDRVMLRGTFGNIRLKNLLVPGVEGGVTQFLPSGEQMNIFDAAMRYIKEEIPLIVIAGKEYGTGSSRDWAAKGTALLGVVAVIAESYERIHRSNLIGMGVLPLQFQDGEGAEALGLNGREVFDIIGLEQSIESGQDVRVEAQREDGSEITFKARLRLDTPIEIDYYRNGGILHSVLREMINQPV
jgi:aconitate hydratase